MCIFNRGPSERGCTVSPGWHSAAAAAEGSDLLNASQAEPSTEQRSTKTGIAEESKRLQAGPESAHEPRLPQCA